MDIDVLLAKIRYMAKGLQVDFLILDHVSIVVSGFASDDERKNLDMLMTKLRSLVEETGIGVIAISHLRRPPDGSYNEGKQVSLSSLRGSAGIEQLSDTVVALERDQQAEEGVKDISTIRVLKNRTVGILGEAGKVKYIHDTGRLVDYTGSAIFDTPKPGSANSHTKKQPKKKTSEEEELDF
jgi:twinkle protein